MENDIEMAKELRALNGERIVGEKMLSSQQNMLAEQLRGEMGKDMMDVLQGKKMVKLSWKDKFKAKLNYLKRLFVGIDMELNDDMDYYYGGV